MEFDEEKCERVILRCLHDSCKGIIIPVRCFVSQAEEMFLIGPCVICGKDSWLMFDASTLKRLSLPKNSEDEKMITSVVQ